MPLNDCKWWTWKQKEHDQTYQQSWVQKLPNSLLFEKLTFSQMLWNPHDWKTMLKRKPCDRVCVAFRIETLNSKWIWITGLVHSRFNISWSFTHPHVIQDVNVFLSSVEMKLRFLRKTFQDFSPFSRFQWGSMGWRSKFQCSFKGLYTIPAKE